MVLPPSQHLELKNLGLISMQKLDPAFARIPFHRRLQKNPRIRPTIWIRITHCLGVTAAAI